MALGVCAKKGACHLRVRGRDTRSRCRFFLPPAARAWSRFNCMLSRRLWRLAGAICVQSVELGLAVCCVLLLSEPGAMEEISTGVRVCLVL